MTDYKNTLNLPQTDFPMKANLAQREPSILKHWHTISLYARLRDEGKNKKKFIFLDGPPYANGHIHVGHAVNKILKDIIVKSKTLSGFDVPFVPGWDCHGLPIELNVEKKHGKAGHKISVAAFRKACRDYAQSQVDIQKEEFIRLGVVGDWENPYLTMDPIYEANIVRSLAKIIENKHLQKGYKPVHWCLDCASALAEAEVEYKDKTSPAIDVRFMVVNPDEFYAKFSEVKPLKLSISVPIWTTTPWSLPGNQAVALNPLLEYALVNCDNKEILLIAKDLLDPVMKKYGVKDYQILGSVLGEKLLGIQLKHPFYDKQVPIVLGDHVTVDSGTGAVHTAPAHGLDDYQMGKQYQLALENPVGDDGCFTSSTQLFAGMHVLKANEKIIQELQMRGMLLHHENINHSYPHCWRHKTPIIFRATPQWFISMGVNGLREKALEVIDRVKWVPEWGQSRIKGMIEGRPDWCISRQRAWGVPITLFVNKENGELHPKTSELMEVVAAKIEEKGVEAWFDLELSDVLGDEASQYQKINDVLDVWFDSGVAHYCVLEKRKELQFPADLILEGSDQHRGWFQSQLLSSIGMYDKEPYREVLTHGFVVDAHGHKMSKSIGNVIAPDEVIKTLGADILRLWVASTDYRTEITATKEILTRTSETYRRIRNTSRFLLSNLSGFDPAEHLLKPEQMLMLDRWIVSKTAALQDEILQAYQTYQFHTIVQKIHNFCVNELGGFYLDIIKDRQYTMAKNSRGRRSAQSALYHIAHAFVRWLAPILSFTAEEIWQYMPGKKNESIFLNEWYGSLERLPADIVMNDAYWDKIREVRDAVNKEIEKERNEGKIGSALEAEVSLYCGPNLKQMLDQLGEELRFVLITSSASVIPEHSGPTDTVVTDVAGLALKVKPTTHAKCERCWHRREDVDKNSQYPGLCDRCIINISTEGEVREFA